MCLAIPGKVLSIETGSDEIFTSLEALDHLIDLHPFQAPRRMSFMTRDGVTTGDVIPKAQKLLERFEVQVVAEDSIQLDVLPTGVNVRQTLNRVLSWIDADRRWQVVVVVGSPDGMSLVDAGSTAIAAVDGSEEWAEKVAQHRNVHVVSPAGCRGIYSAMVHLGLIHGGEADE